MHRYGKLIATIAGLIAMYFSDGKNISEQSKAVGLWAQLITIAITIPVFIVLLILRYRAKKPLVSHKTLIIITLTLVSIIGLVSSKIWGWISSIIITVPIVAFFYYLCVWVEREEFKSGENEITDSFSNEQQRLP